MNTFHRYGPAALIAVAAMSLAACNGSSKPSAAAASGSPTTAVVAATTSSAASPVAAAASAPPAGSATPAATATPAASAAGTSAPPPAAASSGGATTSAGASSPATSSAAAPPAAGGSGKCTDLTDAAASAAVGKAATIKADAGAASLPGLSICTMTITGEDYPVQLAVDTTKGAALFTADLEVSGIKTISGVGDKAFVSQIGVEALAKGVDIKVTGPAGPVLNGKFAIPTAIAKAMVAALA